MAYVPVTILNANGHPTRLKFGYEENLKDLYSCMQKICVERTAFEADQQMKQWIQEYNRRQLPYSKAMTHDSGKHYNLLQLFVCRHDKGQDVPLARIIKVYGGTDILPYLLQQNLVWCGFVTSVVRGDEIASKFFSKYGKNWSRDHVAIQDAKP